MDALSGRQAWLVAAAGAAGLAMFLVLAVVPWPALRHLDAAAPAAGHAWLTHATAARTVALVVTDLGSPLAVDVIAVVAVVVLLVARRWRAAVLVAVARLGQLASVSLLKVVVHRPRPDLLPQLTSAAGTSFPSGHAAGSAAVYGTVAIVACAYLGAQARRWLLIGVAVWVALVAASRVLLGVHYPTDVLGGVAVGALWLGLAAALLSSPRHTPERGAANAPST